MYKFFKKLQENITQLPVDVFICDNKIIATKTTPPRIQVEAVGDFCLTNTLDKEEDFMMTMAAAFEELCSGEVERKSPYVTIRTRTKLTLDTQRQISLSLFRVGIGMLKFDNPEKGNDVEWESPEMLSLEA